MAYHHTHKPHHETGIRTVHIRGIATQFSNERGALLIWGDPTTCKGRTIRLEGRGGEVEFDARVEQSFVPHHKNGRTQYVANFPRLVPGNYVIRTSIGYHDYDHVTISSRFVTQLDWS